MIVIQLLIDRDNWVLIIYCYRSGFTDTYSYFLTSSCSMHHTLKEKQCKIIESLILCYVILFFTETIYFGNKNLELFNQIITKKKVINNKITF